MHLRISHTTTYAYDAPVVYGLQQVRLTPKSNHQQTVLNWDITVQGATQELSCADHYGNVCTLVQAHSGATLMSLTVSGEVQTRSTDGIYGTCDTTVPLWHFRQHTRRTEPGRGIARLSKTISRPASNSASASASNTDRASGCDYAGDLAALHRLSARILRDVPYTQGATDVTTTAEQALALGGGVCQDHAQIFIAALRGAGVPARYVSGYLMMDDRIDQNATHAWAEAHIEGLGWVGFDVSNGISPDERYVRLAVGRDARDAAPVSGLRMGTAQETLQVALQVQQ